MAGPPKAPKRFAIAPLRGAIFKYKPDLPFVFAKGIELRTLPESLASDTHWWEPSEACREPERPLKSVTPKSSRERVLEGFWHSMVDSKYALIAKYEYTSGSEEDEALQRIISCNLAIWLAKPSPVGFDCVVTTDEKGDPLSFQLKLGLTAHQWDLCNDLQADDLSLAKSLFTPIQEVHAAGGPVWTAINTLWVALIHQWLEQTYLFLWIALEALFGPADGRKVKRRLSRRIASFLGTDRRSVEALRQKVRDGYRCRCEVAHGMRLDALLKNDQLRLHEAEELIRDALKKILLDADWVRKISGKDRERHLDKLP